MRELEQMFVLMEIISSLLSDHLLTIYRLYPINVVSSITRVSATVTMYVSDYQYLAEVFG